MHILRAVPKADIAIGSPAQNHRKLGAEVDEAFVNQRGIGGQRQALRIRRGHDPPLALAIITIPAGFQDARGADAGNGGGKIGRAVHRGKGRRGAAKANDELLFRHPVLRGFKGAGVGQQPHITKGRQRRGGDVLEFIGDDRAIRRKFGHGLGIPPFGAGEGGGNFGGDAVGLGRVDMAAITKLGRGHGDHPPQLAAAQNADGLARWYHRYGLFGGAGLMVGGGLEGSGSTGPLRHGGGLGGTQGLEPFGQIRVFNRQNSGRQKAGIGGPGLANRQRADRNAGGHLDNRQKTVLPRQGPRLHRHAQHRQMGHAGNHARQVRGAPRPGNDDLEPSLCRTLGKLHQPVGCAMRRDDARIICHAQLFQRIGGAFHRGPVRLAAHDDGDGNGGGRGHLLSVPTDNSGRWRQGFRRDHR